MQSMKKTKKINPLKRRIEIIEAWLLYQKKEMKHISDLHEITSTKYNEQQTDICDLSREIESLRKKLLSVENKVSKA